MKDNTSVILAMIWILLRAIMVAIWIIGVIIAEGFWLTVLAFFFPPYGWALFAMAYIL